MTSTNLDREFILSALDLLMRAGTDPETSLASPFISVIMPVRNRAAMIGEALASLDCQTWRNFEAIVIDDASTDETGDMLGRWVATAPWLRVVRVPTRIGASAARNLGLEIARGAIFAYLDSDNLLYRHALGTIAAAFRHSPDTWSIYTSQLWAAANGTLEVRCPNVSLPKLLASRDTFDLNAFAHRRALYDALGGFDERLTRLSDWELALRYCKAVMPKRVATPTSHYRHGDWQRISNDAHFGWNHHLVHERHVVEIAKALRVLYLVEAYPRIAEAHIVAEYGYMLSRGVSVGIWSETAPEAPASDLPSDDDVEIYRGSLAEAIAAFRPDVLHLHAANAFDRYAPSVEAAAVPLTVRGHSFDPSPALLERLQQHGSVGSIYVYPTESPLVKGERSRLKLIPQCFDPAQYNPRPDKDRGMVVQVSEALPNRDIESFIEVGARCPQHRFVLFTHRTKEDPGFLDTVFAENAKLGSPVEIRADLAASEVANQTRCAGIYLHSHGTTGAAFGLPISIAEAMATGAYVLGRRSPDGPGYIGSSDRLYDTVDQAAERIGATLGWNDRRWQEEARLSIEHAFCRHAPHVSARGILDDWLALTGSGYLPVLEAKTLVAVDADEALFFGTGGLGVKTLRTGFHAPERWGVWTGQREASLAFSTSGTSWAEVDSLILEARVFSPSHQPVPVRLCVNGRQAGSADLEVRRAVGTHELPIPRQSLRSEAMIAITFTLPRLLSPAEFGARDRRRLGIGLKRLAFGRR